MNLERNIERVKRFPIAANYLLLEPAVCLHRNSSLELYPDYDVNVSVKK
jgi:hypothetical protein